MGKKILILFVLFSTITLCQGVIKHRLKDVVIIASKKPMEFSELTRTIKIITKKDLKKIPVNDISDVLQFVAGVDMKQRGVDGVQSDISIRGGSSEQTLILVDGIKVTDPQTGHHNLNIPLSTNDIERIEILEGQGSRVHGPNAFSGVVNIITKKGLQKDFSLTTIGGQNGYYSTSVSAAYPTNLIKSRISFNRKQSDGYIHNTDYQNSNFSYNGSLILHNFKINAFIGYIDKKFGANKFYSIKFPDQWEHTKTTFVNSGIQYIHNNITFESKVYYRKNKDDYILIKEHPEIYENFHKSNTIGAEISSTVVYKHGSTSFGGEFIRDGIISTNLGNHRSEKKGLFVEQSYTPIDNLTVIGGFFVYNYAQLGWKIWPGLEAAYHISSFTRIYANIGKSFRSPNFTELYYTSPTNKGNKNLKSEETLNYEIGFFFSKNKINITGDVFKKEGQNLIDWTRTKGADIWTAQNISMINTIGFDVGLKVNLSPFQNIFTDFQLSYTWLHADKSIGKLNESKYLLDFLRHQVIGRLSNNLLLNIHQNWTMRYEERINFGDSFLVDTQIERKFKLLSVFIRANNLLNKKYSDITGVELPGRWITVGIKLDVGEKPFF